MPSHEYHVVPFIGQVKGDRFTRESATAVAKQLQSLIEAEGKNGWEFYSVEKVSIEVKPGCLGQLFGGKTAYIDFDQVVFRRPSGP